MTEMKPLKFLRLIRRLSESQKRVKAVMLTVCGFTFLLHTAAHAYNTDIQVQTQNLQRIQQEIDAFLPELGRLRAQRDDLSEEKQKIQNELINIADRVHAAEKDLTATGDRIKELNLTENNLTARLRAEKSRVSAILSAQIRLSLAPSSPLGSTDGTMESVQTSILLRSLKEELQTRTDALRSDLEALNKTRLDLNLQRENLFSEQKKLSFEERNLKLVLDAREEKLAENNEGLQKSELYYSELTDKVKSIESLIESVRIYEEKEEAKQNAFLAEKRREVEDLQSEAEEIARSTPDETLKDNAMKTAEAAADAAEATRYATNVAQNDSGFDAERGRVGYPVSGKMICNYGSTGAGNCFPEGVTFETRPGALVTTPVAGKIGYAGNFKNYGQMVLVQVSNSYVMIISGMEVLNVKKGQRIAQGEPIGRATRYGQPRIYLEIRKNEQIVNPTEWLKTAGVLQ